MLAFCCVNDKRCLARAAVKFISSDNSMELSMTDVLDALHGLFISASSDMPTGDNSLLQGVGSDDDNSRVVAKTTATSTDVADEDDLFEKQRYLEFIATLCTSLEERLEGKVVA